MQLADKEVVRLTSSSVGVEFQVRSLPLVVSISGVVVQEFLDIARN